MFQTGHCDFGHSSYFERTGKPGVLFSICDHKIANLYLLFSLLSMINSPPKHDNEASGTIV